MNSTSVNLFTYLWLAICVFTLTACGGSGGDSETTSSASSTSNVSSSLSTNSSVIASSSSPQTSSIASSVSSDPGSSMASVSSAGSSQSTAASSSQQASSESSSNSSVSSNSSSNVSSNSSTSSTGSPAPQAHASADAATYLSGDWISLSASDSSGNGDLTFLWEQLSGPSVTFTAGLMDISFAAPEVDEATDFSFTVTVTDDDGLSDEASVEFTVAPSSSAYTHSFHTTFTGDGNLTGFLLFDEDNPDGIPSVSSSDEGVTATQIGGRYRAEITTHSGNSARFLDAEQGRLDGVRVRFPFEVIARNVGVGQIDDSQIPPPIGGFYLAGIQVHNADFESVDYAHLVVGHAGNDRAFIVEGKNTANSNSVYDYALPGQNSAPLGRADLRMVGAADGTITAYWQRPANGGQDNWILYKGNHQNQAGGPGKLPGTEPELDEEVIVGLVTYASGGVGDGFVGTADSFSVDWAEPSEQESLVNDGDRFYILGNSLIGSRGGMHNMLRQALQQAPLAYNIQINLPSVAPPDMEDPQDFDGFYYSQGLNYMYNTMVSTRTEIANDSFNTVMTISGSTSEMQNYYNVIAPAGARHLVYQTWGWPNNPAQVGLTTFHNNIQSVINTTRNFETANTQAVVAPTGYVFYELTVDPIPGAIRVDYLFDPNDNHQSLLGNLVGAYVVYSTLTGRSPEHLNIEFTAWNHQITRVGDMITFTDATKPTMTFSSAAIAELQTRVWQLVQNWKAGPVTLTPVP